MVIGLQRYFNIKHKVSPMLLGSLYRGDGAAGVNYGLSTFRAVFRYHITINDCCDIPFHLFVGG